MQIKKKLSLTVLSAVLLSATVTQAQISVETDGRVRVGTLNLVGAQLDVGVTPNDDQRIGARISNDYIGSSYKYGLYNAVSGGGTNKKYGFYNEVFQNANTSSETYGVYNLIRPNGGGIGYGIYNKTQHQGTGINYGIYNATTRYSLGGSYGMYNETRGEGNYTTYGIYNKVNHDFKGNNRQFGLYNYVEKENEGSVTTIQNTTSLTNTTGVSYGMKNYVTGSSSGAVYGIHSYIYGTHSGNVYGVYSSVSTSLGYTGFFSGNVYVSGTITQTSDESTKKDIKNLDNALALIKKLDAKTYYFKDSKAINLPKEKQYGFLAQDLEKVLPALVKEVKNPDPLADDSVEEPEFTTLKSVNYTALIPILVEALKEQQQEIEELKALINKK